MKSGKGTSITTSDIVSDVGSYAGREDPAAMLKRTLIPHGPVLGHPLRSDARPVCSAYIVMTILPELSLSMQLFSKSCSRPVISIGVGRFPGPFTSGPTIDGAGDAGQTP